MSTHHTPYHTPYHTPSLLLGLLGLCLAAAIGCEAAPSTTHQANDGTYRIYDGSLAAADALGSQALLRQHQAAPESSPDATNEPVKLVTAEDWLASLDQLDHDADHRIEIQATGPDAMPTTVARVERHDR